MGYRWPADTAFTRRVLTVENEGCSLCGRRLHICDHRIHRILTFVGPVEIVCKLAHCPAADCPARAHTLSPFAEAQLTLPRWVIGWDVFCWLGHRRFARHWSVPQLRAELRDSYGITLSEDALADYLRLYQTMVAARHQDAALLVQTYRDIPDLVLTIDGLQPEKGHETLYVVRELRAKRVWFAEALLSSGAEEIRRLVTKAKQWAEQLGKPVALWMSDKQDAFLQAVAAEFKGVPHRYCQNHFLRDVAEEVLEADSHAKVKMRSKVRGLRAVERQALAEARAGNRDGRSAGGGRRGAGLLRGGPGDPQRRPGRAAATTGPAHGRGLDRGAGVAPAESGREKRGRAEKQLKRLAGRIDRGVQAVAHEQQQVRAHVAEVREIAATLDPDGGSGTQRQERFEQVQQRLAASDDGVRVQMAVVMAAFAVGLFAGEDVADVPRDNLDLERWFRLPKGHERRIHGRRHAGVRIVQQGATLALVLDAHRGHPEPFAATDLCPYRHAKPPPDEQAALQRRKVMRKARSKKKRRLLLAELEKRYLHAP